MSAEPLIEELGLTSRAYNLLRLQGRISTIAELTRESVSTLMDIRGMGVVSLNDIIRKLEVHGLRLSTDDEVMNSRYMHELILPISLWGEDRMGVPVKLYLWTDGTLHRKEEH